MYIIYESENDKSFLETVGLVGRTLVDLILCLCTFMLMNLLIKETDNNWSSKSRKLFQVIVMETRETSLYNGNSNLSPYHGFLQ